jgi:uncharacterized membrane protein (DUF485 family)
VQATDWNFGEVHPPPADEQGSPHWDFGEVHPPSEHEHEQQTVHEQVKAGPEFVELRRRLRGWVFPMSAAFLLWYFAYVVLASCARELMATPVSGVITVGLLVGLAQFVSTFALTAAYVRFAVRRLDPLAAQIRTSMEDGR